MVDFKALMDEPPMTDEEREELWRPIREKCKACLICGKAFEDGITVWNYKDGLAHPSCVRMKKKQWV
jgi:hypothetical protein